MIKDLVVHQDPWRQLRKLFAEVVEKSRDTSTPFSVPLEFENELLDFVSDGLAEDRLLLEALKRQPRFHSGGYILMFQPQAEAMTLDRDVFVEGPSAPRHMSTKWCMSLSTAGSVRFAS